MRGGELTGGGPDGRLEPSAVNPARKPSSISVQPVIPHPPLGSGGRYQGAARKSVVVALLLTLFLGPLGLCYLSAAGGLVAAATAAVVVLAGGGATLAVIWPTAMALALLGVLRQRAGRRRAARSGASRSTNGNTWFLSNV